MSSSSSAAYHAVPSSESASASFGGARAASASHYALERSSSVSSLSLGGVLSLASTIPREVKFRWDKPSRLIRMERGTVSRCTRWMAPNRASLRDRRRAPPLRTLLLRAC